MKRTKLQNSIIHAQKNKIGISDDDYRAAVLAISNGRTDSSADLDVKEANALIEKLGGTAPKKWNATAAHNVEKLVSHAQRSLLTQLSITRWNDQHATSLASFCNSPKMLGKPYPRTSKEAQRVIEALKAMNKRDGLTTHGVSNGSNLPHHRSAVTGNGNDRRTAQKAARKKRTHARQSKDGVAV